jgi:uncharacterized repeat protein (TIGR04138 family)
MSSSDNPKSFEELSKLSGRYPAQAFAFVREGLKYTVKKTNESGREEQHITGKELCWGLRDFAMLQWGMLAPAVLRRWNITSTQDFGNVVFAMVESGWMSKRDEDRADDFADVFDFNTAFTSDFESWNEKTK